MGLRILVGIVWIPLLAGAADLAEQANSILKENCQVCHGAAIQQSGLDLRTREKILLGGERGAAVTAASLGRSWLWKLVNHQVKPFMPPTGKLAKEKIEILRKWILSGAPMPKSAVSDEEAERLEALRKLEERPITDEERAWWAFVPPERPAVPGTSDRNAIDAFLDRKLEEQGLQKNGSADKRTLIRRVYLNLIGLPPTPEETEAFLNDDSENAWEALVDRLLESPHYGERWGRHWLDLVHYADSGGYERDFDWPTMWRYRDYVIDAFNNDKPYDQFIIEQIAGDEVNPDSVEANIATGYLRMVLDNNIKDERTRMDELDDNVATTSQTFLAMTVQCARCHNHKFDPIPQKDYYQMQAVFFSTKEIDYPLVSAEEVARHEAALEEIQQQQKPLRKRITELEKPHREFLFQAELDTYPSYYRTAWETPEEERNAGQRLNARQVKALYNQIKRTDILARMSAQDLAELKEIEAGIKELDASRPKLYPTARTITEEGRDPLPSYFLHRGDTGTKGSVMSPGVLTVAARAEPRFSQPPAEAKTSWRRRHFAEWIASKDNPLTARVMVNRIWQHHFGEGIVRTPSNFGQTGMLPSHPELLDWLAVKFVDSGWSVKHMHRLMLTSDAYRRASLDNPENLAKDGTNKYFWRQSRNRHEVETIRDQIMAVAGTLNRALGGPAVRPFINPSLFQSSTNRTWRGLAIGDPDSWRRSVYVFSKRSIRYPMFEAFDQPDMVSSCSQRTRSTVAPQALLLMNNAEVLLQSKHFAQRVAVEAGHAPGAQVDRAFELALSRKPTASERSKALEFVGTTPTGLVDLSQTLFNLNEFLYRQ
ncbi:MAG: PSD1 and planctomycete cytochrome C domain-containing protein [Bryobacterales bacterium]|nr:PSD1 and planctomycete cytochrome C domain-containing protein [Bryobacterales bacterium]